MKDFCKRTTDILLALICLMVLSPLILFIYLSIRIAGPAIYKQERIGKGGKPFFIYKFRSMKVNAEENGIELLQSENDPRITRIGRILRMHHLDELPQLFNVLIGDMSFVGYRPERQHYINQIMQQDARYEYLYQIRPGITSYATLYNGYTDTMEKMLKRLEMDLDYLKRRSWWEDIKIMCLTVFYVATGKKF
jgi:lipopolysaccharide/colanic/teichoic acid biosynthesis glycosyltransferase